MNKDQFELIIKKLKGFNIAVLCISIVIWTVAFLNDVTFLMYLSYLGILIGIVFIIDSFDKRPILIIDKKGIQIQRKNRKINWHRISSFSTTETHNFDGPPTFKIDFYLSKERIRIAYAFPEKSINEIRQAILNYSSGYDIKDNGHHNEGL